MSIKVTLQGLRKRWHTPENEEILQQVVYCLVHKKPLSSVQGLSKHGGLWDLRGAQLSTLRSERKIEANGHSLIQKIGSLKLKGIEVESIDFSYADISYSWWERCKVNNCLFEDLQAKEWQITACDFSNCIFRKANLSHSYINRNIGANSGSFKKVQFVETNLKECIFYFPLIENCLFEDCDLYATNFDGSRMKHCKFKGRIDSPWFRGFSKSAHRSQLGIFNRINPKNYLNPMENIDFSEAELRGVSFVNEIDLGTCLFPNDTDKYIVVRNLEKVYQQARSTIKEEWSGEDKRKGLGFIDSILFNPDHQNQLMDLVDKSLLTGDGEDLEFGETLFSLIGKLNASQSQPREIKN